MNGFKKKIVSIALKYFSESKFKLGANIVRMMNANVLNKALGMICNMFITRIITKYDYGIWSFVCNIYGYLSLITGMGLLSGSFQFGSENAGSQKEYDYYGYAIKIGTMLDLGLVTAFIVITAFTGFSLDGAAIYVQFFVPVLLLEYLQQLFNNILRTNNRIKDYSRSLNINSILLVFCSIFGAFWGIWGLIIGRYIATVITLTILFMMLRKEIGRSIRNKPLLITEKKILWNYTLFTGASSAMNCALYLIDVSMIASLLKNAENVALYRVSTLIPNALEFIPSSLVVVILPSIISNRNNKVWLETNLKKIIRYMGVFNVLLVAILVIFAPWIVTIISGEKYISSVPAFRVLLVGYLINGTFRTISIHSLAALKRVRYNFFISLVSIICDIVFNYILISHQGIMGAAYATLGVETVASVMSYGYLLRHLKYMNISVEDKA